MRILYHFPHYKSTIYAYRTIVHGFKNAFEDLGHEFRIYSADDHLEELLSSFNPDLFMTQTHPFYRRFLNLKLVNKFRKRGMKMFTKIDFWNTSFSGRRINEAKGLSQDLKTQRLIKEGLIGDYFYHVVEQGDHRMDGFEEAMGIKFYTIPLAADKILLEKSLFLKKFLADISFVGTNLPEKRKYFEENIFPLIDKYNVRFYGQDWKFEDKMLGWIQRGGQYFNLPIIRSIQKPKLLISEEGNIYASTKISINIHEEYQRKYGGDCNERTFKIPLAGGFEIVDDVACIKKYFKEGEEIIISDNARDWADKVDYYMRHSEERKKIIENGKKRVLRDHTYHNRVNKILDIIKN